MALRGREKLSSNGKLIINSPDSTIPFTDTGLWPSTSIMYYLLHNPLFITYYRFM